ncbi:MAG: TSCPD domain-containing protein [Chloroflexi bacterium]|nr:TSCPD domain-containing protein [Chloroflexota bacterium]
MRVAQNAYEVLKRRYLAKDRDGKVVETPEQMFRRVCHNLALGDAIHDPDTDVAPIAEEFYQMLTNLEFLPNSPTLMNAGRDLQQLSACFVLPVPDDMEGIFESAKHQALIHKSGGGTGFAFSRLRPENDIVGSTGGIASGPVSFIKIFDMATDVVKQGGTRRGANMGILRVDHPDVLKFIHAKDDDRSIQNFNISVAVTEKFMTALETGEEYDLINPRSGQPCGRLNERTVYTSVRFLDNVVTMNRYPVKQIEKVSHDIRRIGLGVMGWADLLLVLGVPYNSQEAVDLAEQVMGFIQQSADDASSALAEERGVFPAWPRSVYGPNGPIGPKPLRNSTRTTIAPTGTISIIANCSSGIEPLFALSYVRNVMDNTKLVEVNPYFEAVARREGFYSEELMQELADRGTVHGMPGVPEWVQRLFVTAHDITPEWHVKMQAAFQRFTDNAVSKTANFPHEATADDVRSVYLQAYQEGCKGVTIYRDGSKSMQVLSTGQTSKKREGKAEAASATNGHAHVEAAKPAAAQPEAEAPKVLQEAEQIAAGPVARQPRERPTIVAGMTHRVRSGHGNMYVTINFDSDGKPFEIFSALGKSGGCDSAQLEAISRLVSLALRAGVDIDAIVGQLRGITCCPAWDDGIMVRSAPDAVALALAKHVHTDAKNDVWTERTMTGAQLGLFNPKAQPAAPKTEAGAASLKHAHGAEAAVGVRCPDCSGKLAYQEGCLMCPSCGFNKCG